MKRAYFGCGPPGRGVWARRGFTLLELIVVITIIGILGAMVVVRVAGYTAKAQKAKVEHDLKAIIHVAELIQASTGRLPATLEEIRSGKTESGEETHLTLSEAKDPWGNEYLYEVDSSGRPRARCLGKDGSEGGEGDNQDFEEPKAEGQ